MSESLGRVVRKRRKQLHVTQRDLALLAGCSEPFVVALESGKATVRFDKVLDVLRILGLQLVLESGKEGFAIDPSLLPET
jgi:y4mF family transcriptional regulator